MRHFIKISLAASTLLTLFACAQGPEIEEPSQQVEQGQQRASSGYVTREVCIACGCRATDVACDCGLSGPSPKKQECLDNGGPVKKLGVIGGTYAPTPVAPIGTLIQ